MFKKDVLPHYSNEAHSTERAQASFYNYSLSRELEKLRQKRDEQVRLWRNPEENNPDD